jgi:hypothetical protein
MIAAICKKNGGPRHFNRRESASNHSITAYLISPTGRELTRRFPEGRTVGRNFEKTSIGLLAAGLVYRNYLPRL